MTAADQRKHDLNDCGCCQAIVTSTPVEITNRPGLQAIAYRAGIHPQFKESMLAELSSAAHPGLQRLRTREDDDFSIALLDAWATVGDVLTFYQERYANELYLRTSTERRSVGWLTALIGYQLRPGVAASTWLAFTLETAAGGPASVSIDPTVKVQSVPGPGEKPQVFEPVETIEARPEWNVLTPRLTVPRIPVGGDTSVFLSGVTTNLRPGDYFVLTGLERQNDKTSDRWDFRKISGVEPDSAAGRTLIRWEEPLGSTHPASLPPAKSPRVYAFRLRAAIFGHNAQSWAALPVALRVGEANPDPKTNQTNQFLPGAFAGRSGSWSDAKFATTITTINLDTVYPPIVLNSWIALAAENYTELYRVTAVSEESKADFNMSAKTTRLGIEGENIQKFSPQSATVYAQSEELAMAETPVSDFISGSEIVLDRVVEDLEQNRRLLLQGKRPRVTVLVRDGSLVLQTAAGATIRPLVENESLTVLDPPQPAANQNMNWHVVTDDAVEGYATGTSGQIAVTAPLTVDPVLVEAVTVARLQAEDAAHTRLVLNETLANTYYPGSVTIQANVALATHGETIAEVLGSGDPSVPFQSFTLRQSPLTYTAADTPSGGETSLSVRVNGILWKETPSLFGANPRDHVYITRTNDNNATTVEFGDGVTGERVPKGSENVTAVYRKGIGRDGMVKANQLTQLIVKPLGLKKVNNPQPASGAQDRQQADDARQNAPLTVLTLDRIVSLLDYQDFARSFSGIAKALATWTWNQRSRGILLTVAGVDGDEVVEGSNLYNSLTNAIAAAGDVRVPVAIKSYRKAFFRLAANVKEDPDYDRDTVIADVIAALRANLSFDQRDFGQAVALSEVVALIQSVSGVIACDVTKFYRTDDVPGRNPILQAETPQPGDDASVPAAELLTLDPAPLDEPGVMS
jgi:hypothetical protein